MEYNHAYDWNSSTTANPAYGWDSVSPDSAYDFIVHSAAREHGQSKTQAEQKKPLKQKATTRRKCALASSALSAIVLFLVVVSIGFGIVIYIFGQENQMLRQQLQQVATMPAASNDSTIQPPTSQALSPSELPVTSSVATTRDSDTVTTPSPQLGSLDNPASSCRDIPQDWPSGEYWIQTESLVQVFCNTNPRDCSCNTTGGWMRVASLDMTDPTQNCPNGLRLVTRTEPPVRTCGRHEQIFLGCSSSTYPVYRVEYTHVCGRIIGYQDRTPDAFAPYARDVFRTIDSIYVEGVSLTHGQSPRKHIWTFAAAIDEVASDLSTCPCGRPDLEFTGTVPPYIGQDYFCATGSRNRFQLIFFPNDPLWDGQGCGGISTCCEFNNPPWFCKQLPQPTTDDLELRVCGDHSIADEDTPLEMIEIYVH